MAPPSRMCPAGHPEGGPMILPSHVFLTKGVGRHREKLASFEAALRDAGIASYNLVRVSSIFPPHCKIISRRRGLKMLTHGQIAFVVISDNATNEPHRLLSASIGVAIPKDPSTFGYLSEYHSFGERERKAGDYAEDLAAQMLATTLGVRFNPDTSYDERKEIWKISGEIYRT
ncbi:MAG TPA: arginine decarboxylase, pyruvoyl-dependent, partial [candidate division WOR-3 bacterium]|nr:arginine decarboxylase, pyruvoyl-dependent [candidate division WOR-3 bacterium]